MAGFSRGFQVVAYWNIMDAPLRFGVLESDGYCGQDHWRRALSAIQRCSERGTVAVIQVQVVNGRLCDLEPDGFADDEGYGLRFEFTRVVTPAGRQQGVASSGLMF